MKNTPEAAKEFLPIIQGLADGRTVQLKYNDAWDDYNGYSISFDREPSDYRLKPLPKIRKFRPGEVQVGWMFRLKVNPGDCVMVTATLSDTIFLGNYGGKFEEGSQFRDPNFAEVSKDLGKTWGPAGVEEPE
ncbi:MAG: hypothetical protein KGL39_49920 [Patescibacteria group bacterium]|nr:hypothetical protein [Patescibacteria group bacterium]